MTDEEQKIMLAVLKERVDEWINGSEQYRVTLCDKISELKNGQIKIFEMLYDLPCKQRAEMYKGLNLTIKLMWTAIGVCFGLIVAHLGWR